MYRYRFFLVGIVFLAAVLRLWRLGWVPPGIHGDEAHVGYTAYSILKTGTDLWGKTGLSLTDVNGGGTFPPLLSYILVPFFGIFGLNLYVNRLPSALFGIASVVMVASLVHTLTRKKEIALAAAFLLAVNPWSMQISRQALLESTSLGMVLLGAVLFFLARERPWLIVVSALSFGLSLFAYDAPRVFVPVFIMLLAWYRWKFVLTHKTKCIIGVSLFILFYGVFLYQTFWRGDIAEYSRSSLFDAAKIADAVNSERTQTLGPRWMSVLMHNKATTLYKTALTNYASLFSLSWLFVNGPGNLQYGTGRNGQYHLFEFPLVLIGLYAMFVKHRKALIFVIIWMLLGFLPGGLSSDNNALRSSLALPAMTVLSAAGLVMVLDAMSRMPRRRKIAAFAAGSIVAVTFIASYLFTYFFDYPVYASEWWSKQQNDAIRYAVAESDAYDAVYIDGGQVWAATYGFLYQADPKRFQQAVAKPQIYRGVDMYSFGTIHFGEFGREFKSLPETAAFFPANSLVIVIGNNDVFPADEPVKRFYDPGGIRSVYKAIVVRRQVK